MILAPLVAALPGIVRARDPLTASGRVLQVGPSRALRTPGEAAMEARDGDVVEIDASDYVGGVAAWPQRNLVIRGVKGRPRILAGGRTAEGKGIFVVRGEDVLIENLSFSGARAPERNGSGIRLEAGRLRVRASSFSDNEMAILTSNEAGVRLEVENCEFEGDGRDDNINSHILYAGKIDRLVVLGSYFHRGKVGHLVKSRARESLILYNRVTDENGTASYEVEFPNGGLSIVLGNLIAKGPRAENAAMISFGAEGYQWPRNELHVAHNTLVNDRRAPATFVAAHPGNARVRLVNNLFVGPGGLDIRVPAESTGNSSPDRSEFAQPDAFDYRLRLGSRLAAAAGDPGAAGDFQLWPTRQYVHPAKTLQLERAGGLSALSPGALQRLGP